METAHSITEQINAFDQREKFSLQAWEKRGLHPSDETICLQLNDLFHHCCNSLILAVKENASSRELKNILNTALNAFNKSEYDTEEKVFICDLFYELASIVHIDYNSYLNRWLYGSWFILWNKLSRLVFPGKAVKTIRQPCRNCRTELETLITKKQKNLPDLSWFVGRCNHCGELNLISPGAQVKEIRFGNYQWVDTIQKDEYTYDQALTRVEQIKYFRRS